MSMTHQGRLRPLIHVLAIVTMAALITLAGPIAAPPQFGATAQAATGDNQPVATVAGAALKRKHPKVSAGERIVRIAARQVGDPYRWGASGPNAFDCSGLTMYAVRKATGKRIPHSSSAQRGSTRRVSAKSARRGDLVFFYASGGIYHVAIYAGGRKIWHSPKPGGRVQKVGLWTSHVSYGRLR